MAQFKELRKSDYFIPGVGFGFFFVLMLILLLARAKGQKGGAGQESAGVAGGRVIRRRRGNISACNVLQVQPDGKRIWQFNARNGGFELNREQSATAGQALPAGLSKDWRALWQPKLNIAWLPPENVFLKVVQLPKSEIAETLSMVELQLEKLSPIPVGQIVWSLHVLPHSDHQMQTVVVMIVARNVVEEFLGALEGQGFLADRLELPLLDQLQSTPARDDGALIYPEVSGGKNHALVAWWYGGVLQNLDLVILPSGTTAQALREQLTQMAWAGEMEGWLTAPPQWKIVAEPAVAANWVAALREGLETEVAVLEPTPRKELAALTATRAAHTGEEANLLPLEYSTRYHQQFVDRLWMRALGALVLLYVAGVAVYLVAVQFLLVQTRGVEGQVAGLGGTYTNTMQLKAQFQVLKDREELRYSALDCWRTVAELLPENVNLDSFNFSDGKRLTLIGTAPANAGQLLIDFDSAMRKAPDSEGKPLFKPNVGDYINSRLNPGAGTVTWNCSFELRRSDNP
jgi:hypothetical protein